MSYSVTVKKSHHNVADGTEGERVEEGGQVMYQFEAANKRFAESVSFSWNYIQNHKQYFEVSRGESDDH